MPSAQIASTRKFARPGMSSGTQNAKKNMTRVSGVLRIQFT